MIRNIFRALSVPVIHLLKPFKVFAYRTRFGLLRRAILEATSLADFVLILLNVQNETMLLHYRAYRGNFIFGKSVMVTDHATAEREIRQPSLRGNHFMGVHIVASESEAFATNSGSLSQGPPTRGLVRRYMDEQIFTERVRAWDHATLRAECAAILDEWSADPAMATMGSLRGTTTRLFLKVLAQQDLPKDQADRITRVYLRRFGELSLFAHYLPMLAGVLGTVESLRKDAYLPLRRLGVDNLVIDMTLFAAMFSIGTLARKCVEYAQQYRIDYPRLPLEQRQRFVIEAVRLYPTVTSVHRIVEGEETVPVAGRELKLGPGDEVAYPFTCIHRDARRFTAPEELRLDRPQEEVDAVLSWSKGPHACPAKDLSILITVLLLDRLGEHHDLQRLKLFELSF